jgi:archaeal chaperonin
VHDAVMVIKDVLEKPGIVGGGGAVEEELSYRLMKWSSTLQGREQLAAEKYAEALESIPITLAENAGFDPLDIRVELREKHADPNNTWFGVNVLGSGVVDLFKKDVVEPVSVKGTDDQIGHRVHVYDPQNRRRNSWKQSLDAARTTTGRYGRHGRNVEN